MLLKILKNIIKNNFTALLSLISLIDVKVSCPLDQFVRWLKTTIGFLASSISVSWIYSPSSYESLPPYIEIGDNQLQSGDRSTPDLLDHFSELLATFKNCGLTTNEPEYGKFTTVPPVKEGISNW